MFPDFTDHPDYVGGHTKEWYEQLSAMQKGRYEFPWNFELEGDAAEDVLSRELSALIRGKVLDVGCGHGEYTNRWANSADEVVGFDINERFIDYANLNRAQKTHFICGRKGDGLPFPDNYFDLAYTKKGPTSWYKEGNRVVRPGGTVLLFHPGDGNGEGGELGICFPGLFPPPAKGTPTLDVIQERLAASGLSVIEMSVLKETGWIPTAEDVFILKCFGQNERYTQHVRETCYDQIMKQFEKHAAEKGIKTTGFYYLIRAKAN